MDNLGGINSGGQSLNDPVAPNNSSTESKGVSHAPLDLGASPAPAPAPVAAPVPAAAPAPQSVAPRPVARPVAAAPRPVMRAAGPAPAPTGRIRGVKTFFTKLHPGAIEFLDEQITKWLCENPDVSIKHTNVTVGEVQAKKTEPNILITVWF